ncbi:hypothetical protein [Variovorax sp.]|jgi:hypothetical protein|uniref:hypothetical protein n=1 Tax=Variovorax sp. TaxID=1871043 RepID=UPI004037D191
MSSSVRISSWADVIDLLLADPSALTIDEKAAAICVGLMFVVMCLLAATWVAALWGARYELVYGVRYWRPRLVRLLGRWRVLVRFARRG